MMGFVRAVPVACFGASRAETGGTLVPTGTAPDPPSFEVGGGGGGGGGVEIGVGGGGGGEVGGEVVCFNTLGVALVGLKVWP